MSETQQFLTEIPSSLKQLARLVVRGFYTIEDALIIDMLVRNPCMKEDDICELLRFEKKQLRARVTILKNDKFLQVRLKMETGADGKAQKVNYYFINYKTFVNVVKYKLDLMRKRMETEERDATSRASFKCPNCNKTFTDLEADQLFDKETFEFRCTYCGSTVEEDLSALPKKDSRLMLAKFNEQLQSLYDLLREVEEIKLAPELLEPEPIDIDTIRGVLKCKLKAQMEQWSGEATRGGGFAVEEARVEVNINNDAVENTIAKKDRPVWMSESTVLTKDSEKQTNELEQAAYNSIQATVSSSATSKLKKESEDIMSVLLVHEKHNSSSSAIKNMNKIKTHDSSDDSSDDDKEFDSVEIPQIIKSDSDESDNDTPTVMVAGNPYSIEEINDNVISQMTPQEKEVYIQVYQDHFSHIYD